MTLRRGSCLLAGVALSAGLLTGCISTPAGSPSSTTSPASSSTPSGGGGTATGAPSSSGSGPAGPSSPTTSAPSASPGSRSSTPSSSARPSATSSVPVGTKVSIATSGDILVHYPVQVDAAHDAGSGGGYDFDPMFARLKAQISAADVAICHQETPISSTDTGLTPQGSMVFNAPPQIATALKSAGFDGCDNASNHVWDRGLTGIQRTDAVLARAGLQHSGPTGAGPRGEHTAYYRTGPKKSVLVAALAYSYTIVNDAGPNLAVPSQAPWLKAILWPAIGAAGIEADARNARAHGADLVVISIHWGTEYHQTPTSDQLGLAKALLTSGAVDLIVGAHAHVVQPCQRIDGRYVLYGMGNFLSNQAPSQDPGLTPSNQDGMLDTTTFTRTAAGWHEQLTVQPTYVATTSGHVIERATTTNNPASLQRTTAALHALHDGSCNPTIIGH